MCSLFLYDEGQGMEIGLISGSRPVANRLCVPGHLIFKPGHLNNFFARSARNALSHIFASQGGAVASQGFALAALALATGLKRALNFLFATHHRLRRLCL